MNEKEVDVGSFFVPGIIIALLILYDLFKSNIEVFFVRINDPLCGPADNSRFHSFMCQNRYCMLKLMKKITEKISSAQKEIDIAMYSFTNHQLKQSLQKASKRGVLVRLLLDRSMLDSDNGRFVENNRSIVQDLKSSGM